MNREQKRKAIKSLTAKGYTTKQAEALTMLKATQETKKFLKEGDRVKLNIPQMKSRPEWKSDIDRNKARFQAWVLAHQDMVLTVEYDKNHQNNPSIVCMTEDETDPKWLFWEGDLDVVERANDDDHQYPCDGHECYDSGNFHVTCGECPLYHGHSITTEKESYQ